jgi:hypothetical protein
MAEAPAAVAWARETLARLRATPLLARLDEAIASGPPAGAAPSATPTVAAPAPASTPAEVAVDR